MVQMISKGRDMEAFFAQVVKNVASPSIEIRKLVSGAGISRAAAYPAC
jgi:AP-3 complex subunit beta